MGNTNIKKNEFKIYPDIEKKYLLGIINVQNDFFDCGLLPVKDSKFIVDPINNLQILCEKQVDLFFSQEYGFSNDQTSKLNYCIRNTPGCEFHKNLIHKKNDIVFKNVGKIINHKNNRLNKWVKDNKYSDIIFVGIDVDFVIYNLALNAILNGCDVHIIRSCIRSTLKSEELKVVREHLTNLGVKMYDFGDDFIRANFV